MNEKKRILISKKELYAIIGFIVFYVPPEYALPKLPFMVWKYSCGFVALLLLIYYIISTLLKKGINIPYLLFLLYYMWISIGASFFSQYGEIKEFIFIRGIGYITYLFILIKLLNVRLVIRAYIVSGLIMSGINLISFFIYKDIPGGMRHGEVYLMPNGHMGTSRQHWYFLSYDNDTIFYFIPVIVLLFYYAIMYSKRAYVLFYAYTSILLYTYILQRAATCVIALSFLMICYFYIHVSGHLGIMESLTYNRTIILGFIITILPLFFLNSRTLIFISAIFGKKGDISRSLIWDRALYWIRNKIVLGIGIESREMTMRRIYQTHCHNLVLELLYVGGIIALGLFVIALLQLKPKCDEKNNVGEIVFMIAILAYFITSGIDWLLQNPIPLSVFIFNYYLNTNSKQTDRLHRIVMKNSDYSS